MKQLYKTNRARRLLGTILLDGSFVSPDDLGEAIERQRKTSAQLGGILVGMGVLGEADLEAVLSVQRELASPADTIKAAAGVRELLGELLVRVKRLTPGELAEILAEQERTGEKLGTLLVRRGLITGSELDAVLAFQRRQGAPKSQPSPLRLGEVLVRSRLISREKIEEALRHQKLSRKKIGEVLVESGYLKPEQLAQSLRLQQRLLTATLVAALSFASVLPVRAFDLPPSRAGAKSQLNIATIVKVRADAKTLRQTHRTVVSDVDIARGYAGVTAVLPTDPVTR
jgi:chitinase